MSNTYLQIMSQMGSTMRHLYKHVHLQLVEQKQGISGEQFGLLNLINEHDDFIQTELAYLMDKHKSAVMRHIDILEKKKLVARENDPNDRRRKKLVLTKKGVEKLESATRILDEIMEEATRDVTREELDLFYKVLVKMKVAEKA